MDNPSLAPSRRKIPIARLGLLGLVGVILTLLTIRTLSVVEECVPVRRIRQGEWTARDSHVSTFFLDRFWVFGGWFDSNQENLRDAWVSADGIRWDQVAERLPFPETDYQAVTTMGSRLYLMGGWADGRLLSSRASSNVWSTADGATWTLATDAPGWSPRLGASSVTFHGKIWLLGGVEDYHHATPAELKNDVWVSDDGAAWTRVTEGAPWSPRGFAAAAVFRDHIYLVGGGSYRETRLQLGDVWRSADGVRWERITSAPAWSGRIWHTAVVADSSLFLIGGWRDDPPTNLDEVWRSRDGERWERLPLCSGARIPHASRAVAVGDRIYQFGGATDEVTSSVYVLEPGRRVLKRRWFP